MALDQKLIGQITDAVRSVPASLGFFRRVQTHEPKGLVGRDLSAAFWLNSIEPLGQASGLAKSSGYLIYNFRIYGSGFAKPEDEIDPKMTTAAAAVLSAYSGNYTAGGLIRAIDLLGMYGTKLAARAGYLTVQQITYRIIDVSVPCIVDDMWAQVA